MLEFNNQFVTHLPADKEIKNYPRQVYGACYSRLSAQKFDNCELIDYAEPVAELLNLTPQFCQSPEFLKLCSGSYDSNGIDPYAMCYGGHQFGQWAGQLGDGRAINLGELKGEDNQLYTLQLKGAGITPYSRTADGLAVLRSSIREYLCSEAMHHLGIPTTRALSLVLSGDQVVRDMFYNGNPQAEPGAIVCRVSRSFIRFGSFELFASRNEIDLLKQLADYTICQNYPHLGKPSNEVYIQWFKEIAERTADLMVDWMRVGFVHGVMNTDNMSIIGETIDYGPYGWIDNYDPNWTPNTTDAQSKRYRFAHQPAIAHWNLYKLANALSSIIDSTKPLQQIIDDYPAYYQQKYNAMMAQKLGIKQYQEESDKKIIDDLLSLLQLTEVDMTLFFRLLAKIDIDEKQTNGISCLQPLEESFYAPDQLSPDFQSNLITWLTNYCHRLKRDNRDNHQRVEQMNRVNPNFILRNYLSQLAIDRAEKGDYTMLGELRKRMQHPYDVSEDNDYNKKRPEWARHRPGSSMLSCSS